MPPKKRVTREDILESAFELVRTQGEAAVNARSVARALGCSTQPVFSCFATMEQLKAALFEYASGRCMEQILKGADQPDFVQRTTRWYIHLARSEPELFKFIYLSDNLKSGQLIELMMRYESNRAVMERLRENYQLDGDTCRDVYQRGFLFLHGIGTLIATNQVDFSDRQVAELMRLTVGDMVKGALERRKGAGGL